MWVDGAWLPTSAAEGPPTSTSATPSRVDGFAVASLVLGIVWLAGLGSVLAVVFGHVSRHRAHEHDHAKSGLAMAGLVLGYLGLSILLVILVAFSSGQDAAGGAADGVAVQSSLSSVANSEFAYWLDNGSYVDVAGLASSGDGAPTVSEGVTVELLSTSGNGFCLVGRGHAVTYYYDGSGAGLQSLPCAP